MQDRGGSAPPRQKVGSHLFLLSAPDLEGLGRAIGELQTQLSSLSVRPLEALERLYGRNPMAAHRLAILGSSAGEITKKLDQAREQLPMPAGERRLPPGVFAGSGERSGKLAFLFPGQGSQYPGMLLELSPIFPSVRRWLQELDRAYARIGWSEPSALLSGDAGPKLYDVCTGAQLGLVASAAIAEVLDAIGIVPDCLLGHSNGDRAALLAAGALGSKDPVSTCAEFARASQIARLLQGNPSTDGLLSVVCGRKGLIEPLLAAYRDRLFLAVSNSPTQVVLGGRHAELDEAAAVLKKSATICSRLPFERAFHTPLVADWSRLLRSYLDTVPFYSFRVPVYSTLTTTTFPQDANTVRDWVARQWSSTVFFKETVERLYDDGVRIFVEVGPDAKLSALAHDVLRGRPHLALSASSSIHNEREQLLKLCGTLYAGGVAVNLGPLDDAQRRRRESAALAVPSSLAPAPSTGGLAMASAFRREHQLTIQRISDAERRILDRLRVSVKPGTGHVEGAQIVRRAGSEATFRVRLSENAGHPYLRDHAMGTELHGGRKLQIVPFAYTVDVMLDAARRAAGVEHRALRGIQAHRWLALDQGSLDMEIDIAGERARIYALVDNKRELSFEAQFCDPASTAMKPLAPIAAGWTSPARPPESFYSDEVFHGASYHCIRSARFCKEQIAAEIEASPAAVPAQRLDPALLDCAGQLVAYWMLENGWKDFGVFPVSLESFSIAADAPQAGTRVQVRGDAVVGPFAITSANFDFLLPGGALLWRIRGFKQKIVNLPAGMAGFLFGKNHAPLSIQANGQDEWPNTDLMRFLESGQGIWSRVVAHSLLSRQELSAFYALPPKLRSSRIMDALLAVGSPR